MSAVGLFGITCVVQTDTPKYYLARGETNNALRAVRAIYNCPSEYHARQVLAHIEKSGNQETTKLSVSDAMCKDERYARASIICVTLMCF